MASIKLDHLCLNYGDNIIFDDISYLFDNNITVLHGPSGSGKTTLLNCISGIYNGYDGKITTEGSSLMAYCMQVDMLFGNLTVVENLKLRYAALELKYEKRDNALRSALDSFRLSGKDRQLAKTLSGGERQRLKMAMVSLSSPDIILLDEPTSFLDKNNASLIVEIIETVWKGKLVLVSSHDDLQFVSDINTVYLSKGKLYES